MLGPDVVDAPPDDEVGVLVLASIVVARSDAALVAVESIRAFSTGLLISWRVVGRAANKSSIVHELRSDAPGGLSIGVAAPGFRARSAAVPATGSVASRIRSLGAAGGANQAELLWWLSGASANGTLSVDVTWPRFHIQEHVDLPLSGGVRIPPVDLAEATPEVLIAGHEGAEGATETDPPLDSELGGVVASSLRVGGTGALSIYIAELRAFSTGLRIAWRVVGPAATSGSLAELVALAGRGGLMARITASDRWSLLWQPLGGWHAGHPSLRSSGVGGTAGRADAQWWIWPLPDADTIVIETQWADFVIERAAVAISGVAAAARVSAKSLTA